MKVLLLQNIKGIGQKGQIKEVKEGYAQNHLIPNKLAKAATDSVLREVTKLTHDKIEHEEIVHKKIRENFEEMEDQHLVFSLPANDQGALFAKFDEKQLLAELHTKGYKAIEIGHLSIEGSPVKHVGIYQVKAKEGTLSISFSLEIKAR